jgi:hypothetical protein
MYGFPLVPHPRLESLPAPVDPGVTCWQCRYCHQVAGAWRCSERTLNTSVPLAELGRRVDTLAPCRAFSPLVV